MSLNFESILPKVIVVKIGKTEYALKEPTGKRMSVYRDFVTGCASIGEGGKVVSVDSSKAAQSGILLVSLCLYLDGKEVSQDVISDFPIHISDALIEACVDLCGLSPKKDQEEERESLKK